MRGWIAVGLAIAAGLLAAEIIVRVVLHADVNFGPGVRPGAYGEANSPFWRWGWPGFSGFISMSGLPAPVPVRLDEHGYRPAQGTPNDPSVTEIVVMGGASQTFGWGLSAEQTWPARLAFASCRPTLARNIALPGTGPVLDLMLFARTKPDLLARAKVGVLSFYGEPRYWLAGYPENGPEIMDAWSALEDSMRQVVTLHGKRFSATLPPFLSFLERIAILSPLTRKVTGWASEQAWEKQENLDKIRHYVGRMNALFPAGMIVVFLPNGAAPADYYDNLRRNLPSGLAVVDLHAETKGQPIAAQLLPDSHYNANLADHIGRRVAEELCNTARPMK
ncbi:MAG: hypothetical protein HQL42_16195 [Alphaproteobacteria bacterium]|nr:hypothetical protein [Alphaproteobacteria bacterium]